MRKERNKARFRGTVVSTLCSNLQPRDAQETRCDYGLSDGRVGTVDLEHTAGNGLYEVSAL